VKIYINACAFDSHMCMSVHRFVLNVQNVKTITVRLYRSSWQPSTINGGRMHGCYGNLTLTANWFLL